MLPQATKEDAIADFQRLRITELIGALASNRQYFDAAEQFARAPVDPANAVVVQTMRDLMVGWVASNPAAAAAWLASNRPAGALRQAAYIGFAQSAADTDTDLATRFVRAQADPEAIEGASLGVVASYRLRGDTAGAHRWLMENMGENGSGAFDLAVEGLFASSLGNGLRLGSGAGFGLGLDADAAQAVIRKVRGEPGRKRIASIYGTSASPSAADAFQVILQFYSERERWDGVVEPSPTPGANTLRMIGRDLPYVVSVWARKDPAATQSAIEGLVRLPTPDRARLMAEVQRVGGSQP